MAKTILTKNLEHLRVSDIKIDYKVTLIKTVVLMQRQTHRYQLNRVNKQTYIYSQLIYSNINYEYIILYNKITIVM